jgi:hypothetical protein
MTLEKKFRGAQLGSENNRRDRQQKNKRPSHENLLHKALGREEREDVFKVVTGSFHIQTQYVINIAA